MTPLQPSSAEAVLDAMRDFDSNGWPEGFGQRNLHWYVLHPKTDKEYPCKAIWGLATGRAHTDFSSGLRIREVLERLGFRCVKLTPSDLPPPHDPDLPPFQEGVERQVTRNMRERNPAARKRCIDHFRAQNGGRLVCEACNLDFSERYGELGADFIHVHHLDPLANAGDARAITPETDLVPVCPNCHAMLHRGRAWEDPLPLDDLRALLGHDPSS